jgi:ketosteroid isomerase-like protein
VIQSTAARSALESFERARDIYLAAFKSVPQEALGYLRDGDDYSLGGIAVHVNFVLEHYANTLDAIRSAGFSECRPQDPPGLEDRALAKARESLRPDEVEAELSSTRRLHDAVAEKVAGLGEDWSRQAPVWFGDAAEAYPTGGGDVLNWLTGHYQEHVPHMEALAVEWRGGRGQASSPIAVVERFNEAFGRGDVDAIMALMTDDCVFENTFPAPAGERHVGAEAVRLFWTRFFAETEAPRFETEELFGAGDRVVARWLFSWGSGPTAGHVRGVDLLRVRDDKVAEKLSYVKG